MMFKKEDPKLLDETLLYLEEFHYAEQFLDVFADYFESKFPVERMSVFMLNKEESHFVPYCGSHSPSHRPEPSPLDDNLATYLRNSRRTILLKDEPPARIKFLSQTSPGLFHQLKPDIFIPLLSLKKLYGFIAISSSAKTFRELPQMNHFFKIFSNILVPLIISERIQLENSRNYYKIYRMDRLAMVGELAASAAHEIKNPLAGISTYIRYFSELSDFRKTDIIEELMIMKDSIRRIDEIVKSLLSFSRFKKKKITRIDLTNLIEITLQSIALKIPAHIRIIKKCDDHLTVESDESQFQQVLVNILFNALEAIGKKEGEICIATSVSGQDQFPSRELFHVSVKDTGPGIPREFMEKLFQPFQTTKEEGTGLGLYTCYGLMKSLGGDIKINSDQRGAEVILSLPYSFDEENDN